MKIYLFILVFIFAQFSFSEENRPNIVVPTRTTEIKTFPCSKCHQTFNAQNFEIKSPKEHPNLTFKHMPDVKKCTLCHSSRQPDMLNLQEGTVISYNETVKICGQCHGKVAYNWSLGSHGKNSGNWRGGTRNRWTCTQCHNPHAPKFPKMEAIMTPYQSPNVIEKGNHHE